MNKWKLIDWDGNPDLKLKCWRKKFGRGYVSVGVGEFLTIVYSHGANSDDSISATRWRRDGNHMTEQEAMNMVDGTKGFWEAR
jgi:queuine/archaeosine tRNA-ribosyltransferase